MCVHLISGQFLIRILYQCTVMVMQGKWKSSYYGYWLKKEHINSLQEMEGENEEKYHSTVWNIISYCRVLDWLKPYLKSSFSCSPHLTGEDFRRRYVCSVALYHTRGAISLHKDYWFFFFSPSFFNDFNTHPPILILLHRLHSVLSESGLKHDWQKQKYESIRA